MANDSFYNLLEYTKSVVSSWWNYNVLSGINRYLLKLPSTESEITQGFVHMTDLVINSQDITLKHILTNLLPTFYGTLSPCYTLSFTDKIHVFSVLFYDMQAAFISVIQYMCTTTPARCISSTDKSGFLQNLLTSWTMLLLDIYDDNLDDREQINNRDRLDELHIKTLFLYSMARSIRSDLSTAVHFLRKYMKRMKQRVLPRELLITTSSGDIDAYDLYSNMCSKIQYYRECKIVYNYLNTRHMHLKNIERWFNEHRLPQAYKHLNEARLSIMDADRIGNLGELIHLTKSISVFDINDICLDYAHASKECVEILKELEIRFQIIVKSYVTFLTSTDVITDTTTFRKMYYNIVKDNDDRTYGKKNGTNHTYRLTSLRINGALNPYENITQVLELLKQAMIRVSIRQLKSKYEYFSQKGGCLCKIHCMTYNTQTFAVFKPNKFALCQAHAAYIDLHNAINCKNHSCDCVTFMKKETQYVKYLKETMLYFMGPLSSIEYAISSPYQEIATHF